LTISQQYHSHQININHEINAKATGS